MAKEPCRQTIQILVSRSDQHQAEDIVQEILENIQAIISAATPAAAETSSYQMPTFALKGNLVHFAAFKKRIGFYPTPTGIETFKAALAIYESGQGAGQLPLDVPMPLDLIRRMMEFRVPENLAKVAAEAQAKRVKKAGEKK